MSRPVLHGADHSPGKADAVPDLRWFYVLPVAPAAVPADYVPGDGGYVSFAGSWLNIGSDVPATAFGLAVGGKPLLRLGCTGGEAAAPSLIFTTPAWCRPSKQYLYDVVMGADGLSRGTVRWDTDGTVTFLGSLGGFAHAIYNGNPVSVADGVFGDLTWDTLSYGDALLDTTDPTLPVVVTSGVYAVSLTVRGGPLDVGGAFHIALQLDTTGDDAEASTDSASNTGHDGDAFRETSVSVTYYIPPGGKLYVPVFSRNTTTTDFWIQRAIVQRIS